MQQTDKNQEAAEGANGGDVAVPDLTAVAFTVPSIPIAQPRQRHRVANINGRTMAMNYTPKSDPVNAFKASVQIAFSNAYQGSPLTGPLRVSIQFFFPRTKQQASWKRKPQVRLRHCKKPDADNCCKSIFDALNKIAWLDDSQICECRSEKWIAAGDEQPRVEILIEELTEV